jgi:hypothetical protein
MYGFAPFMVVSPAFGAPRALYGGVYTVGGYNQGVYYLTWVTTYSKKRLPWLIWLFRLLTINVNFVITNWLI